MAGTSKAEKPSRVSAVPAALGSLTIRRDREGNPLAQKVKLMEDPKHGYLYANDCVSHAEAMKEVPAAVKRYLKTSREGGLGMLEVVTEEPNRPLLFEDEHAARTHGYVQRMSPDEAAREIEKVDDAQREAARRRQREREESITSRPFTP